MKYKYTYVGENPCDFPTVGIRDVNKGDTVESDEQLFSPFLIDQNVQERPAPKEKGE